MHPTRCWPSRGVPEKALLTMVWSAVASDRRARSSSVRSVLAKAWSPIEVTAGPTLSVPVSWALLRKTPSPMLGLERGGFAGLERFLGLHGHCNPITCNKSVSEGGRLDSN